MRIQHAVLSLMLGMAALAQAQPTDRQDVVRMFAYDQKAPLDIQEKSVEDRNGIQVHDISFASPMGGRVSAYLVAPQGKGPFAGIIFVHSGQWDRHEFLAEAELLASSGAVSLLLDAPRMRPKEFQQAHESPLQNFIQLVVDCRRAVDLLEQLHPGAIATQTGAQEKTAAHAPGLVDPKRIAYVGHSLGATWGPALVFAERRIKAVVLMAGYSEFSVSIRSQIPADQLQKAEPFLKAAAPLDADRLLPHLAPTAILLQFAEFDQFVTHEDAQRSIKAASQPKMAKWYEGAHEFGDPRALPDRAEFLRRQIGIAPLVFRR